MLNPAKLGVIINKYSKNTISEDEDKWDYLIRYSVHIVIEN
jgi:hypothetical protein